MNLIRRRTDAYMGVSPFDVELVLYCTLHICKHSYYILGNVMYVHIVHVILHNIGLSLKALFEKVVRRVVLSSMWFADVQNFGLVTRSENLLLTTPWQF